MACGCRGATGLCGEHPVYDAARVVLVLHVHRRYVQSHQHIRAFGNQGANLREFRARREPRRCHSRVRLPSVKLDKIIRRTPGILSDS